MRAILIAVIGLLVGLAIFIAQGGHDQRPVFGNPLTTADAESGQQTTKAPVSMDVDTAQDLDAEADAYDDKADEIQGQVMKYKREAAAITPLMDTKGFRRSALLMAAASQSKAVAELRQVAAQHRAEAKRLVARCIHTESFLLALVDHRVLRDYGRGHRDRSDLSSLFPSVLDMRKQRHIDRMGNALRLRWIIRNFMSTLS